MDGTKSLEPARIPDREHNPRAKTRWQGKKARAPRAKKGKKSIPPPRRRPHPADLSSAEWATEDDGFWFQVSTYPWLACLVIDDSGDDCSQSCKESRTPSRGSRLAPSLSLTTVLQEWQRAAAAAGRRSGQGQAARILPFFSNGETHTRPNLFLNPTNTRPSCTPLLCSHSGSYASEATTTAKGGLVSRGCSVITCSAVPVRLYRTTRGGDSPSPPGPAQLLRPRFRHRRLHITVHN